MKVMEQKYDELTAAISGIVGGFISIHLMGITWQTAWEYLGQLLWVGFIALFTGGMGVVGKHFVSKWLKPKK